LRRSAIATILLLALGAVAQTPKTAPKPPATAVKKKSTPAKKKAAPKKRVVARKRLQQKPAPERYAEIQQALIGRGHLQGPATGVWGPDSVAALKGFQESQKLEATGKIDALSLIRLGLGPQRDAGLPPSEPTVKP
jgi:peptidoglycan hydrolase-like protein with peptidoglycan-binding domain